MFTKNLAILSTILLYSFNILAQGQGNYQIPVVIYLMDDRSSDFNFVDENVINLQLAELNQRFTGPGGQSIQFCLASKYDGNSLTTTNAVTSLSMIPVNGGMWGSYDLSQPAYQPYVNSPGIIRVPFQFMNMGTYPLEISSPTWNALMQVSPLPQENFLKIFVVPSGWGAAQGESTTPFYPINSTLQGIYVDVKYFGSAAACPHCAAGVEGRVLPHEVGHYLGLYHTYHNSTPSSCPDPANCSSNGDFICDTPPHSNSYFNSANCGYGTGSITNCQLLSNFTNIMQYPHSESCMQGFTPEQWERMIQTLEKSAPAYGYHNIPGSKPPEGRTCLATECNQSLQGCLPPAPTGRTSHLGDFCWGIDDIVLPNEACGTVYTHSLPGTFTLTSDGIILGSSTSLPSGIYSKSYSVDVTQCGGTNTYTFNIIECCTNTSVHMSWGANVNALRTFSDATTPAGGNYDYYWTLGANWGPYDPYESYSNSTLLAEWYPALSNPEANKICLKVTIKDANGVFMCEETVCAYVTMHTPPGIAKRRGNLNDQLSNSENSDLEIYPNPVRNKLFWKGNSSAPVHIQLYDPTGKLILESSLYNGESLDVSHLNSGIYFIQLIQNQKITQKKLIID